jgi:hypothetical protein
VSNIDLICQAIEKRLLLTFVYKGEDRTAEPYILGYDGKGTLTLSAVQVSGGSGPGFRTFPLSGISMLAMTDRHFARNHPDYNPRDRFFARIICQI